MFELRYETTLSTPFISVRLRSYLKIISIHLMHGGPALQGKSAVCVCFLYRSVNYNTEILPLTAASPLANLPDDDVTPLMDTL